MVVDDRDKPLETWCEAHDTVLKNLYLEQVFNVDTGIADITRNENLLELLKFPIFQQIGMKNLKRGLRRWGKRNVGWILMNQRKGRFSISRSASLNTASFYPGNTNYSYTMTGGTISENTNNNVTGRPSLYRADSVPNGFLTPGREPGGDDLPTTLLRILAMNAQSQLKQAETDHSRQMLYEESIMENAEFKKKELTTAQKRAERAEEEEKATADFASVLGRVPAAPVGFPTWTPSRTTKNTKKGDTTVKSTTKKKKKKHATMTTVPPAAEAEALPSGTISPATIPSATIPQATTPLAAPSPATRNMGRELFVEEEVQESHDEESSVIEGLNERLANLDCDEGVQEDDSEVEDESEEDDDSSEEDDDYDGSEDDDEEDEDDDDDGDEGEIVEVRVTRSRGGGRAHIQL